MAIELDAYLESLTGDDKTAMKTAIQSVADLEVGADVQAYDADLTTWGAKTAPSGTVVGDTDTQTLSNKSLKTDTVLFVDPTDPTKKLQLVISGFTTGTTRTLTILNTSDTLVNLGSTQTLFSKTFSSPSCKFRDDTDGTKIGSFVLTGITTGNTRQLTWPNAAGTIALLETTQTISGAITFSQAFKLPTYTVATLPSASTYSRGLIYVSDGTSNKRLAISDGTNWRWPDGAIVS